MRDSVKFQKNSNKKSRKNNHKNGGFEWYRHLGKNAYKTTKYLPYLTEYSLHKSIQVKENAIRISQTTITNLKIELRAEWSKSPTVLTTTQAARLVGCSNDLINSWMKKEDGLRFVRVQNGVFTTKEWLIDYFAHYTKEKNQRYRISK